MKSKLNFNFHDNRIRAKGNPKLRDSKELYLYSRLLVLSLVLHDWKAKFDLLTKRIAKFFDTQRGRKNLRQVFTYLKECHTVLNSVLVGGHYEPKVRIAVDKHGIPKIIPPALRMKIRGDRKIFVAVCSLLGIYRLIQWWPAVDLTSIISPFSGESRTIDLSRLKDAKVKLMQYSTLADKIPFSKWSEFTFRIGSIRPLRIEKSGPNGKWNWSNAIEDAFAFYGEPRYLFSIIRWMFALRSYNMIASLLSILIIGAPLYLILRYVPVRRWVHVPKSKRGKSRKWSYWGKRLGKLHIGRLATVYNVSGKARVVGITNYWVQLCLYPLHKSIFDFLKTLSTDGAFDQIKPLNAFLANPLIHVRGLDDVESGPAEMYSLDLTAATDRLPLEVQEQVLSLFTSDYIASLWGELVRIPFVDNDGFACKYAVGQPMGCYSSWAMLSLTHHMIVNSDGTKLVYQERGKYRPPKGFIPEPDYAVLGDDIVMSCRKAPDYLSTMRMLGVEISLPKSIISSRYVEFAKRVLDVDQHDWSPIGPGLILAAVRNKFLTGLYLAELLNRELIDIRTSLEYLFKQGFKVPHLADFGIFVLFGLRGLHKVNHKIALNNGMKWLELNRVKVKDKRVSAMFHDETNWERVPIPVAALDDCYYETLCFLKRIIYEEARTLSRHNLDLMLPYLWQLAVHKYGRPIALLYWALMWLSPFPYHFIRELYDAYWNLPSPIPTGEETMDEFLDGFRELHAERLEALSHKETVSYIRFYIRFHKLLLKFAKHMNIFPF